MKIGTGIRVIRFCLRYLRGLNVGITDGRDFMMNALETASCGMIHLSNFMMIGTGVQAILRFCFGNLNGCNFGIIDGRDL
jgi:hypothetical protein